MNRFSSIVVRSVVTQPPTRRKRTEPLMVSLTNNLQTIQFFKKSASNFIFSISSIYLLWNLSQNWNVFSLLNLRLLNFSTMQIIFIPAYLILYITSFPRSFPYSVHKKYNLFIKLFKIMFDVEIQNLLSRVCPMVCPVAILIYLCDGGSSFEKPIPPNFHYIY